MRGLRDIHRVDIRRLTGEQVLRENLRPRRTTQRAANDLDDCLTIDRVVDGLTQHDVVKRRHIGAEDRVIDGGIRRRVEAVLVLRIVGGRRNLGAGRRRTVERHIELVVLELS